jgi:mannose-6-phosphate isomerase-like protein (cupin superfamily)
MFRDDRPWGSFTVILEGDGFKVKLIEVQPGRRLSYQSHDHRMERWVIVEGTAGVIIEDREFNRSKGEMVEIGIGQRHRLINPSSSTVLKIVEVQLGDYLGEDDITRFKDDFGRAGGT